MRELDTEKLFEAKKQLNDFLRDHPELVELQKTIDDTLKKAGNNVDNRLVAFRELMKEVLVPQLERLAKLGERLSLISGNKKDQE
jgi:methionine salvage enolase-phosphatase E1